MQQGNLNLSWNTNNQFYGYVADNNIYTYTGELVGVNLAKYQEVEQALIKCKNKLIELGEIKVPKTPEEIIKEQNEMLEKQSNIVNEMMNKYAELQQQMEVLKNGCKSTQRSDKLSPAGDERESRASIDKGSGDGGPVKDKNKGRCNTSTPSSEK